MKQPSPKFDQLRAMREASYEKDAEAEPARKARSPDQVNQARLKAAATAAKKAAAIPAKKQKRKKAKKRGAER